MIVFIIGEGLFNDRDGRGAGAATTFRAAGLLVARGPLHAERALVPLTVNPDVSEDTTLETSLVVTRVVLGQLEFKSPVQSSFLPFLEGNRTATGF